MKSIPNLFAINHHSESQHWLLQLAIKAKLREKVGKQTAIFVKKQGSLFIKLRLFLKKKESWSEQGLYSDL